MAVLVLLQEAESLHPLSGQFRGSALRWRSIRAMVTTDRTANYGPLVGFHGAVLRPSAAPIQESQLYESASGACLGAAAGPVGAGRGRFYQTLPW